MKKTILTLSLIACSMISANALFAGGIKFGMPAGALGCWSYGICEITWVTDPMDVTATYALTPTGDLVMSISRHDIEVKCPENLPHFDLASSTVDFPNDYVATPEFNAAIGATSPVVIPAGVYPFTIDAANNFVVVVNQGPAGGE